VFCNFSIAMLSLKSYCVISSIHGFCYFWRNRILQQIMFWKKMISFIEIVVVDDVFHLEWLIWIESSLVMSKALKNTAIIRPNHAFWIVISKYDSILWFQIMLSWFHSTMLIFHQILLKADHSYMKTLNFLLENFEMKSKMAK